MMKPERMLFLLLVCGSLALVRSECAGKPEVSWSFDDRNATTLIPSHTTDQRFYSDITGRDADFVPGINGTALHMSQSSIVLAKNLLPDDCLLAVDSCLEICISFWLKVKNWNEGQTSILSSLMGNDPGIDIGRGDSDDDFFIYIQNGKPYEKSFSNKYVLGHWAWLQISFNTTSRETTVLINGTIPEKVDSLNPKPERAAFSAIDNAKKSQLVLGEDGGPEFYIDELEVYYTRNETATARNEATTDVSHSTASNAEMTKSTDYSITTTIPSTTTEYSIFTDEETGLSSGAIIGIVIGVIVFIVIIVVVARWLHNRCHEQGREENQDNNGRGHVRFTPGGVQENGNE